MFYEQLKKLCEERGIKITPLVTSLGLSSGNIKKWQDGVLPKGDILIKFADYFKVTTDYLLGIEHKNDTNPAHRLTSDETEWLDLIRRLPKNQRIEYKAEIKGYLKHYESVASDENKNDSGKSLI